MRNIVIATATTIISVVAVLGAVEAADLYTTPPPAAEAPPPAEEAPPPVVEAPPPIEVAPPAVAAIPEAPIVVEPRCRTVWRCGYLGCGWRTACAPAEAYGVAPYWRHSFSYREYLRPYLGYSHSRSGWGYSHPRWGQWHRG
jgi:hypothetical protein